MQLLVSIIIYELEDHRVLEMRHGLIFESLCPVHRGEYTQIH